MGIVGIWVYSMINLNPILTREGEENDDDVKRRGRRASWLVA